MYRQTYPYLYETHLHTALGSACAHNTPEEMVLAAAKMGYAGIFVTEHNWRGNSCIDRSLPWADWIDAMAHSFLLAQETGTRVGLSVFFGYEAGFFDKPHFGAEFLIYGLSPQWLKAHPELRDMDAPEHLALVRSAGATVIHAHPFREASYIERVVLLPELVDGVEAVNAAHSNSRSGAHANAVFDRRAVEYARRHGLPMTAGSDIHTSNLFGGGVAFREPITCVADYCRAIRTDADRLLTNGEQVFDRNGVLLPGTADWADL